MLNLVKPRNFMPVHGEWRHLRAHAGLAALAGVPEGNIVIAEDGVVVDLVAGQARVAGAVPCGYVYVDGLTVGEVTESQLKDRRILGDEGFISVVIVVDASSGKMVAGRRSTPAAQASTTPPSATSCPRSRKPWPWRPPTALPTPTRSASSPAASSASGSATTTAAAP